VACLGLLYFMGAMLADAHLDGVDSVVVHGLDLGDLATVDLDNGAGDQLSPVVPEMGHADFIAKEAGSFGELVRGLRLLDRVLVVDVSFEGPVVGHLSVVEGLRLLEVFPRRSIELFDSLRLDPGL